MIEVDHEALMAARLESKAHATAWGLVFYATATEKRRAMWDEFAKRLHRMPRDMKLDRPAVLRAFAESFNLTKVGGAGGELDQVEFKKFADDWLSSLKNARPSWRLQAVRDDQPANPGGQPGGMPPGGPGFPGGPGGGPGSGR